MGFLGVCSGFVWGVMSQCLGTYDLRCLLGDLIPVCLVMNFSSGVDFGTYFAWGFAWGGFAWVCETGVCYGYDITNHIFLFKKITY